MDIEQHFTTRKVAIVTGVSRRIGIGAAIARALAEVGTAVFTTYYRPYDASMAWGSQDHEAESILAELREMGVEADSGKYTPTANGSDATPQNSIISANITPMSTKSHGSLRVRMPSMIKANKLALGASSFFTSRRR